MKKKRRVGKKNLALPKRSYADMFGSHIITSRRWTGGMCISQPWERKTKKCKRNMKKF